LNQSIGVRKRTIQWCRRRGGQAHPKFWFIENPWKPGQKWRRALSDFEKRRPTLAEQMRTFSFFTT